MTTLDPPYAFDALEPHISESALRLHQWRHQRIHVDRIQVLVPDVPVRGECFAQIARTLAGHDCQRILCESAAEAWKHGFFWRCMKPRGGGKPHGEIADRIEAGFGSFDAFAAQFMSAATDFDENGWAWLVLRGNSLLVMRTTNADTPIAQELTPIVAIDVCEHAYVEDYGNRRIDYVVAFLDHLVDWDFANANLVRDGRLAGVLKPHAASIESNDER